MRGRLFKIMLVLAVALGVSVGAAALAVLLALPDIAMLAPSVALVRSASAASTPISTWAPLTATRVVTYAIVPQDSRVSFSVLEVRRSGDAVTRTLISGQTHDVQGQMQLNLDDPSASRFSRFTVNLAALSSDEPGRDAALRDQWLESDHYPLAGFVITEVRHLPAVRVLNQPLEFELVGNMVIHDVSRPVTWQVTATPRERGLAGQATTFLTLADFGLPVPFLAGVLEVEDGVSVTLDFAFAEVKPPAPCG